MTVPNPQQILALPMRPNGAEAVTVRDYLIALLAGVWKHRESFNGKRPFGNSGWHFDLYWPLIDAGISAADVDPEWGWLNDISYEEERRADQLIADTIQALGAVPELAGGEQ